MFRFKKEYAGQTIVTSKGTLINASNVHSDEAQAVLKSLSGFDYMLEEEVEEAPSASTTTDPPVTGGGGAGDPRPRKTRTRKA